MKRSDNKFYRFFKTTLIGGFVVVLPLSILIFIFKWLFGIVSNMIMPMTELIVGKDSDYKFAGDLLVIVIIIALCFFIGLFVKTKIGKWVFTFLETSLLLKIPGYGMVRETIAQLFHTNEKSPFASVALCRIFGNETMVTAFITDKHDNGSYTVFVPTGPNPTSGNIYHLKPEYVHEIDASTEETMRSIISCGAGSKALILKLLESQNETPKESEVSEKAKELDQTESDELAKETPKADSEAEDQKS